MVPVKLFSTIRNDGPDPCDVSTRVRVIDQAGNELFSESNNDNVPAASVLDKQWTYKPEERLAGGFYRIIAEIALDGKPYDRLENGFFEWDDSIVKNAPKYELKDNVFRVNGRPTYMPGADMHGSQIDRWMDGPLCWYKDARAMRDFGFLQDQTLDAWAPWTYGNSEGRDYWHKKIFSRVDGVAMACREAGLEYMPCEILCGDMALGDDQEEGYDQRIASAAEATGDFYRRLNFPHGIQDDIGGDIT